MNRRLSTCVAIRTADDELDRTVRVSMSVEALSLDHGLGMSAVPMSIEGIDADGDLPSR